MSPLGSSCTVFDATCHCGSPSTLSNHVGNQSQYEMLHLEIWESGKLCDHGPLTQHEKQEAYSCQTPIRVHTFSHGRTRLEISDHLPAARCHHTYGSDCIQAVCILYHCKLGEYSVGHLSPKFLLEPCKGTTLYHNVFPRPVMYTSKPRIDVAMFTS